MRERRFRRSDTKLNPWVWVIIVIVIIVVLLMGVFVFFGTPVD